MLTHEDYLIELKAELKKLDDKEDALQDQMNANTKKIQSMRERIWIAENGVQPGDEVTYRSRYGKLEGFRHRYTSLYPLFRPYNKDGQLSARVVEVWSGAIVSKVPVKDA